MIDMNTSEWEQHLNLQGKHQCLMLLLANCWIFRNEKEHENDKN